MTDWARLDAIGVLDHVRATWKEPIVHVGHSFGGQLLGLIDEAHDVDGALLVASPLPWVGHWKAAGRLRVELSFRMLMPLLTRTFGYLPGWAGLGEDLPAGVAREWASWCLDPDYLIGAHPDAKRRFARFERPVLVYSFTDDDFAPRQSVHRMVSALSGAQVVHRRVAPSDLGVGSIGHFGFFRPRFEHSLWRDARGWIETLLGFEASDRRPLRAWDLDASDIERDLMYGRAD
jgi:predicted alpha/beta hydrolase